MLLSLVTIDTEVVYVRCRFIYNSNYVTGLSE
jgi:hypothetical protein